jgi:hypothetical protein
MASLPSRTHPESAETTSALGGWLLKNAVKAPIIVDDEGDLSFFRTVDSVERYIEAVDVEAEGYSAYDSEGRRLRLTTRQEQRPVLFGLFRVPFDRTIVECEEAEPAHAEALRSVLTAFLRAQDAPATGLADPVSLQHILDQAIEKAGFTR